MPVQVWSYEKVQVISSLGPFRTAINVNLFLALASSHTVQTQQSVYLQEVVNTCRIVASNVFYQSQVYGDNSLGLGNIFINEEIEQRNQEDSERVRQLDREQFLAHAAANQKKQPYSAYRTVTEEVKYELLYLICETEEWNLSKAWNMDILNMFLNRGNRRFGRQDKETLLMILDYGLQEGSDAALVLKENLLNMVNTHSVDKDNDVEVGLFRTL